MPNTYIDTNKLPHTTTAASEYVEVLNHALCGAKNVVGTLRWLRTGQRFDAVSDARTNQLLYLMEGEATITLNAKNHEVAKGHGIYLGPSESATITHRGTAPLKLFHLVVPQQGA